MKLSVEKENFLFGINASQKAIASKTTMPILECFKLETRENFLVITATDLELGIEYKVEITDKQEDGEVAVDAKIISEIIRKLPDSTIELSTDEKGMLIIECEGSLFKVVTTNCSDFPILPEIKAEQSLKIKQNVLKEMIRKTIFAVGIDETRPIFTGCLIERNDAELNIVALDGYRLAVQTKIIAEEGGKAFKAIVPGRTLNEISKILSDTDDLVEIGIEKNQGLFEMKNFKATTRVLEGEFLDYKKAIPEEKELRVKVKKTVLLNSLERAAVMSRDEKQFPVKMTIDGSLLVIQCAVLSGDVREEVVIESVGKNLEIGFNPKYLIEAVRATEEEQILLDFGSAVSPCVIRPEEGNDFTYMVLPVRI